MVLDISGIPQVAPKAAELAVAAAGLSFFGDQHAAPGGPASKRWRRFAWLFFRSNPDGFFGRRWARVFPTLAAAPYDFAAFREARADDAEEDWVIATRRREERREAEEDARLRNAVYYRPVLAVSDDDDSEGGNDDAVVKRLKEKRRADKERRRRDARDAAAREAAGAPPRPPPDDAACSSSDDDRPRAPETATDCVVNNISGVVVRAAERRSCPLVLILLRTSGGRRKQVQRRKNEQHRCSRGRDRVVVRRSARPPRSTAPKSATSRSARVWSSRAGPSRRAGSARTSPRRAASRAGSPRGSFAGRDHFSGSFRRYVARLRLVIQPQLGTPAEAPVPDGPAASTRSEVLIKEASSPGRIFYVGDRRARGSLSTRVFEDVLRAFRALQPGASTALP